MSLFGGAFDPSESFEDDNFNFEDFYEPIDFNSGFEGGPEFEESNIEQISPPEGVIPMDEPSMGFNQDQVKPFFEGQSSQPAAKPQPFDPKNPASRVIPLNQPDKPTPFSKPMQPKQSLNSGGNTPFQSNQQSSLQQNILNRQPAINQQQQNPFNNQQSNGEPSGLLKLIFGIGKGLMGALGINVNDGKGILSKKLGQKQQGGMLPSMNQQPNLPQGPQMPQQPLNKPAPKQGIPGNFNTQKPQAQFAPVNRVQEVNKPPKQQIQEAQVRESKSNFRKQGRMELGSLSARYESNGNPGTVSHGRGDKGGVSYGQYQFASRTGSLNAYLRSSKYGHHFKGLRPATAAFNRKWKELAKDPGFAKDQHNYIQRTHYDPVRRSADKLGVPNSNAINQVLWSTGVQHGPGGARKILQRAYKPGMSESQLIKNIYRLRGNQFRSSSYYNSSPARRRVKAGVLNRFRSEMRRALRLI